MSLIEDCVYDDARTSEARLTGHHTTGEVSRQPSTFSVVVAQTSPQRVDVSKNLVVRSGVHDAFVVTHMSRKAPGHGMTESQTKADAYVACMHLDRFDEYDMWCDEQHEASCAVGPGTIHINDMRQTWRADIQSPFNVVNFYIPQSLLNEIADDEGNHVEELYCPISRAQVDIIFNNLVQAMLPALARPEQANRLFADHALRAITAHLIRGYGSRIQLNRERGGLASWQERRAKELLRADLSGDICLQELASACRLSSSHFSQAFKQTVGCPPHQWLLHQRVEQAKNLILNTKLPLSEIALATGFADQSHFTRVFSQRVKVSPAAWRRAQER
jgi:AraC-like DNA-binding protein